MGEGTQNAGTIHVHEPIFLIIIINMNLTESAGLPSRKKISTIESKNSPSFRGSKNLWDFEVLSTRHDAKKKTEGESDGSRLQK